MGKEKLAWQGEPRPPWEGGRSPDRWDGMGAIFRRGSDRKGEGRESRTQRQEARLPSPGLLRSRGAAWGRILNLCEPQSPDP